MFSVIGIFLLGGVIKKDSLAIVNDPDIPSNYYLCNFNDLATSMITLFELMVVNNW